MVAELERHVGAADAVMAGAELGVGEDPAHVARPAQAELAARDEEVLALAEERVGIAFELGAGRVVARGQDPEADPAGRPRGLGAPEGIHDPPRVHRRPHDGIPARASSKLPIPSMKNGRFSEKKRGKRWLTWTWKASLSTWLKSGLIVPSTVAEEVTPYLTDRPASGFESAGPKAVAVARVCR